MFDNIFAAIEKWMRELLSGMVESNLSTMFTAVNQQTSEIAAQVGQTPQGWNSSIFSMIRNISDSVVIPIAGIIPSAIFIISSYGMFPITVCVIPRSDVLKFLLEDNCSVVVRPSGTEPKLKTYISISAENKETAEKIEAEICKSAEEYLK